MTDYVMYKKILTAIKECRRDRIKMFGSGLPLSEKVIKRLQSKSYDVFAVAESGVRTYLITGYLPREVILKDITPTLEEWEASKAKSAKEVAEGVKDDALVQGPYVITEEVEIGE